MCICIELLLSSVMVRTQSKYINVDTLNAEVLELGVKDSKQSSVGKGKI